MKRVLLALTFLFATPAAAQIYTDGTFDVPGSHMEMGDTADVAVTGGKVDFTGPDRMTSVHQTGTTVKRGRRYRIQFTISDYTSGSVSGYAGLTMTGPTTGSDVPAPSITGLTPIADNFTFEDGIIDAETSHTTGESGDSATFRFKCVVGPPKPNDGIAYYGQSGRSHLHTPFGNTESLNENISYEYLRQNGSSFCGDPAKADDAPIVRAAYWMPSLIDMKSGMVVNPRLLIYYRRPPASFSGCTAGFQLGCIAPPHGIRQIDGFNFATGTGGPDTNEAIKWICTRDDGTEIYLGPSMTTAISTCAARNATNNDAHTLRLAFDYKNCWDGARLDTVNHRDHMALSVGGVCNTASHPYMIPGIGILAFYPINQNGFDGYYKLSSDSMVANAEPGSTIHADYFNAWSPEALERWTDNCHDRSLSCNGGDMGDGFRIDMIPHGGGDSGATGENEQIFIGGDFDRDSFVPTGPAGLGKPCRANGVCRVEVTAHKDGEVGIVTHELNTVLKVDNLVVTEL
jgi:hypothetical protein